MYEIRADSVEFKGYENDCYKFLYGFLGVKYSETQYIDGILGLNGVWSEYGTVEIRDLSDD